MGEAAALVAIGSFSLLLCITLGKAIMVSIEMMPIYPFLVVCAWTGGIFVFSLFVLITTIVIGIRQWDDDEEEEGDNDDN